MESMLAIFFTLATAVAISLALNFFFQRRKKDADKDKEASVRDILGATSLLAALLIAIVLSGASSSYTSARAAAKAEADTVDNLYEAARRCQHDRQYTPRPFAIPVPYWVPNGSPWRGEKNQKCPIIGQEPAPTACAGLS